MVKINRRGRRQERLLGVDLQRLTNRKVEKSRLFFSDATVHAERLVSDIRRLEVPEAERTAFSIVLRDARPDARAADMAGAAAGQEVTVRYEARNANERDEIVSKLAYILRASGQLHKIVRLS